MVTGWGFLLVRGETLGVHHHPVASSNAGQCLTKLCSRPVRIREKPCVLFFALLLRRKCWPDLIKLTTVQLLFHLSLLWFLNGNFLAITPRLCHIQTPHCSASYSIKDTDWSLNTRTNRKCFSWSFFKMDGQNFWLEISVIQLHFKVTRWVKVTQTKTT